MADTTLKLLLLGEDRSASSTLKGVGTEADRSHSKLNKLAGVAKVALVAGFAAAGAAAVKFTQQAAEDSQAAAQLAQTLQRNAKATRSQVAAVEDWISAQGKATGITDDELRPALQRLVAANHDIERSQKMARLAQDVAAGTGKSYTSVVEALVKAENGQISGLSRLGIQVRDADGKTKSLRDITKDLANTYGGQSAAAAETAAGKQKILSTQMSELGESIGYTLLPAMETAVEWLTKIVEWVSQNSTQAKILAGVLVGVTVGVWALNAAMSANPISLVVIAIAALVVGLIVAYNKSETFRKIVDAAFSAIGTAAKWMWENAIKPAFEGLKAGIRAVGAIGKWLWNNVFQPVFKFIVNGVASVLEMWSKMLAALGKVPGFGWAKDAAKAMGNAAEKARAIADGIKKIPDHKSVTITYHYRGLRGPGGAGPTRGGDDEFAGPRMARGGIVTRPTLALIGEAGPEAVVPLTGPHARSVGFGSDLGTVRLDLRMNGKTLQTELLRLKRTNGGLQLGLA